MALHDELTSDQQRFIDSFLLDDLKESQKIPLDLLFDITGVVVGYRPVCESAWQETYNTFEEKEAPAPQIIRRFHQKSGIPYLKNQREGRHNDKTQPISQYLLFEPGYYNEALEIFQTFSKTSDEIDYHSTLGDLFGYPEFAAEDFKEHGWDEPNFPDLVDLGLQQKGDLLDLVIMLVGTPYSFPMEEKYHIDAYEDAKKYRTQLKLHIDEYEYISELVLQSQKAFVRDLGDQHNYIREENIVRPENI